MMKPHRAARWVGALLLGATLSTSAVAVGQPGAPRRDEGRQDSRPGGHPGAPVLPLPGADKGPDARGPAGKSDRDRDDGKNDGRPPHAANPASPLARIAPPPRDGSRDDRRRQQRDEQRPKLAATLVAKPIDDALRGELRRHAEMVARLDRIIAVATVAKDDDARGRAQAARDREHARHDRFLKGWR